MKLNIKDFTKLLPHLEEQIKQAVHQTLDTAKQELLDEVQNKVGQPGDWPALSDATLKAREREGYGAMTPLLLTGHLRESYAVDLSNLTLSIGSNDPIAKYIELGTENMPPRPIVYPVVNQYMETLTNALGEAVVNVILQKKND